MREIYFFEYIISHISDLSSNYIGKNIPVYIWPADFNPALTAWLLRLPCNTVILTVAFPLKSSNTSTKGFGALRRLNDDR